MEKSEAIQFFGGQCKLADFLGVPQSNVSVWKNIPKHYQEHIEAFSDGALKADKMHKKVRYQVLIEEEYLEILRNLAEEQKTTIINVIRKAIKVYKVSREQYHQ